MQCFASGSTNQATGPPKTFPLKLLPCNQVISDVVEGGVSTNSQLTSFFLCSNVAAFEYTHVFSFHLQGTVDQRASSSDRLVRVDIQEVTVRASGPRGLQTRTGLKLPRPSSAGDATVPLRAKVHLSPGLRLGLNIHRGQSHLPNKVGR